MEWDRRRSRALGTGLIAVTLCSLAAGCSFESPPSAGNTVIWFAGDLHLDDRAAYEQLCEQQRDRVSLERFAESQGAAVSPMLTFSGWRLSESALMGDIETVDEEVSSATLDVSVAYQPNGAPDTELRQSEWAVGLKREDGHWKLCSFEHLSGDPGPVPVEPIFGS